MRGHHSFQSLVMWIAAIGLCALSAEALASSAAPLPANAVAHSYGDGWDCRIGFLRKDDDCVAV